ARKDKSAACRFAGRHVVFHRNCGKPRIRDDEGTFETEKRNLIIAWGTEVVVDANLKMLVLLIEDPVGQSAVGRSEIGRQMVLHRRRRLKPQRAAAVVVVANIGFQERFVTAEAEAAANAVSRAIDQSMPMNARRKIDVL